VGDLTGKGERCSKEAWKQRREATMYIGVGTILAIILIILLIAFVF
jgi:hypothetical protein